jgi:hypothetical protein
MDVVVQFNPESSITALKAINWQGKRQTFVGSPHKLGDRLLFTVPDTWKCKK